MPQVARLVVPGLPHHITQRGNRRLQTFFRPEDYQTYLMLMAEACARHGVEIWSYCLMPNHAHLIAVPSAESALAEAMGEAHKRYTLRVNAREGWTGYLWQGRFGSYAMDERHTLNAARYIEMNPVAAGLVVSPTAYPWSSAAANVEGRTDLLVQRSVIPGFVPGWKDVLLAAVEDAERRKIELHTRTGRPLGSEEFISRLEGSTGRTNRLQKRGRKPRPTEQLPLPDGHIGN